MTVKAYGATAGDKPLEPMTITAASYTALLKRDGTMVLVGVPEHPHPSPDVPP